jgi:alginate O-acetyltransferase complex protein AlgJ
VTAPFLPRSGEGTIGRGTAVFLTAVFVVLIVVPVAWQASDNTVPSLLQPLPGELRAQGFKKALERLEKRFERQAVFAQAVRVPYHTVLLRWLSQTTEGTSPGQDGFLFYRADLTYAWGQGPLSPYQSARLREARDELRGDSFEDLVQAGVRSLLGGQPPETPLAPPLVESTTAVIDVVRQFRERGVSVLVVPVPGKAAIYPELYAPSYPLAAGPAENRGMARWKELLKAEGVPVVDLARPLWEAKSRSSHPLYLKIDSHWSPDGMAVAADAIAARAAELLGPVPRLSFTSEQQTVSHAGDQMRLLDVSHPYELYPKETLTLTRVEHGLAEDTVGDGAPVLLLGDSYTRIYQDPNPAFGAGLSAQLMLRLGCGVQTIAWDGMTPAQQLHLVIARPKLLNRKKLVIWTFVDRTVVDAKAWEKVQLPPR